MRSMRESGAETTAKVQPSRRGRAASPRVEATLNTDDLSRFVQSNSGILSFAGLTLGVFLSRKFFVLPIAVAFTVAQEMAKERVARLYKPRRRR
jgi:hypothetical protein